MQSDKIVGDIFNNQSECAFNKSTDIICAPDPIVDKMVDFLDTKGVPAVSNGKVEKTKIIGNMKELLDCNSESCIIKHPEFISFAKLANIDGILDEFFKPAGPATHFGLLSNINIDKVLDQFEERFPGFLHIEYQMRDFEKVGTELATIDLAKELTTHNTFGVVLNTDWSTGGGIHWYCIFGELKNNKLTIEYFNSSGKEPLSETQAFLHKTKHYLTKTMKIPVYVKYFTGIQFQKDEHSCGVYCLMYIWLRLEGVQSNWFTSNTFNDSLMHKARRLLFRLEV